MKITLIIEGKTEKAFLPHLRNYLAKQLANRMPKIDIVPYNGRIPTSDKLRRVVENLLTGKKASDHVIALTDVYTGANLPVFLDAGDAKNKMRKWVGSESRFHPHAALHDFEAWLLPYWKTIQQLARHNKKPPAGNPEAINHANPPSKHIQEIFRIGAKGKKYIKPRDGNRILRDNDLSSAIIYCAELKSFVNTILSICDAKLIP